MDELSAENAVAAIRVSSVRQGTDGDSPEAQKEQIESFATLHDINLKETFIFLESASKDQQPMQQAIDYCKDPKNDIQLFIIKSIDRFTRGGATPYDQLKMQLEKYGVKLVDIYGIISQQKVNTLAHLGVKYRWSEYSPSQKMEFLEAERAKDELRDIMSCMIGAEVRYTRMGYWMRRPPYGFTSKRVETGNGKRYILIREPDEAPYIEKMFDLRCQGNLSDQQIVDEINSLGYKSRYINCRASSDKTVVSGRIGGSQLTLKRFWLYVQNPIYAGVIYEKWTEDQPVKAQFEGLISFETFNQANRGKLTLSMDDGLVKLTRRAIPEYLLKKGVHNAEYPYRKVVTCPICRRPLFGSAAKGRNKYYPGYHCNKRGHHFRVPKEKLESSVEALINQVTFTDDHIEDVMSAIKTVWGKRQVNTNNDEEVLNKRMSELKAQAIATVDKIKLLSSETAIKYMEEDLMKIEDEISTLTSELEENKASEPISFEIVMKYAKFFLQHIDYLLLQQSDPIKKADFFSVLFDKVPTYEEISSVTADFGEITGLNELFKIKRTNQSLMVRERGLEPPRLSTTAPQTIASTIPPLAQANYYQHTDLIVEKQQTYYIFSLTLENYFDHI